MENSRIVKLHDKNCMLVNNITTQGYIDLILCIKLHNKA